MEELESLYKIKDPSREEIYKILVDNGMDSKDANNTDFVYRFQEKIRTLNEMQYLEGGFHEEEERVVKDQKVLFYKSIQVTPKKTCAVANNKIDSKHQIDNWTIRFYSATKEFSEIKSNLQLTLEDTVIIYGNTNGEDWTKFGNVGNTFYALYCENKPIVPKYFLKQYKYYAEFLLKDINDLWISNDWIDMTPEKGGAYRGNGIAVFNHLTQSLLKGEMLISSIKSKWPTLEAKIPHSMEVIEWLDNMEL